MFAAVTYDSVMDFTQDSSGIDVDETGNLLTLLSRIFSFCQAQRPFEM